MNMERREKSIEEYNCNDLHRIFSEEYYQKYGTDYVPKRFIGYEMKLLKSLLESHDTYAILCGIVSCIKRNKDTVSIPYFVAGIKFYIPTDEFPELQWKVQRSNQPEYKNKWQQLRLLKAKWLPKAKDRAKMIELEKELMEWVNEKSEKTTKPKTRTSKTKEE